MRRARRTGWGPRWPAGVSACAVVLAATLLAARAGQAGSDYRIGGGDGLQITVWKNPELSQAVTVRPDGMITLPLVRDVPAAGLTAMELGEKIASRLSAFVNAPNVTVTVAAANSYRVFTQGAVANGMFPLTSPMNVLQLLARAGGPTAEAELARAFVLRGQAKIPVNLEPRPGVGELGEPYPELMSGDVLVVPFKDATRRLLVVGEVRTPRTLPYQEGLTVLDAFVQAGGGTEFADLDSVKVVRALGDGRKEEIDVDLLRMLKKGDLTRNLTLLPGDIVLVPR